MHMSQISAFFAQPSRHQQLTRTISSTSTNLPVFKRPNPQQQLTMTSSVPPESELTLQHVLFFHRHGDRSPILTEVGSKWTMTPDELAFWGEKVATPKQIQALNRIAVVVGDNPSMPPHGVPRHRGLAPLAQLTAHGVDHMIAKGRALRASYDAFITTHGIDKNPHDGSVFVLSSNLDRTIQSVQCLLFGMFHSDKEIQTLEDDTQHPVFPVHTQAINRLAPNHPIEIFNEVEDIVRHEIEKRDPVERRKMEQLGEKLRDIVGVPDSRNVPWTAIRDGLTCRKAHGVPFPGGITEEMYEAMCEYDSWLWHQLFAQKQFCFDAYEHGVREVYKMLQLFVASDETAMKPKLAFFSAHDNSIVALISALQLQVDRILPEYGTVVAFEVYRHDATGAFYIKALFAGQPVAFAGHEHSALCPFGHFDALAQQFLRGPAPSAVAAAAAT